VTGTGVWEARVSPRRETLYILNTCHPENAGPCTSMIQTRLTDRDVLDQCGNVLAYVYPSVFPWLRKGITGGQVKLSTPVKSVTWCYGKWN
jgi:hypothetical protein